MTELSISRSVARAFEVLEYYRAARAPCTMRELSEALHYPYSSVRVIVMGLCELGYLHLDKKKRAYFPTEKLLHLGNWVQGSLFESSGLADLVSGIQVQINETTALTSRNFVFCNFLLVRNSTQAISLQIPVGPGLTLTNSVTGRVLLSQMEDKDLDRIIGYTQYWARNVKAPPVAAKGDIERAIAFVRANGYLADFDVWQKGVGTIAFPVKSSASKAPLAISVSGPAPRIQFNEKKIRRSIASAIERHQSDV